MSLRLFGETITEFTYGAHRDGDQDFVEMNKALSNILDRVTRLSALDAFLSCKSHSYMLFAQRSIRICRYPSPGMVSWWALETHRTVDFGILREDSRHFQRFCPKECREYRRLTLEISGVLTTFQDEGNSLPPSYVTKLLQSKEGKDNNQDDIDCIYNSAFILFRGMQHLIISFFCLTQSSHSAGADTTLGIARQFIYAMICHPEYQTLAQKEIDEVCGDKPPTLADYNRLPYLTAVLLEVMRWNPLLPTGTCHAHCDVAHCV